ncbi:MULTISPECIES: hypothetical protein [unclassified Variovorax]|uniref:hypothetical protein n=1 Tax=unclassified Variovorax TaxID=663243 RepID=UPI003F4614F2
MAIVKAQCASTITGRGIAGFALIGVVIAMVIVAVPAAITTRNYRDDVLRDQFGGGIVARFLVPWPFTARWSSSAC